MASFETITVRMRLLGSFFLWIDSPRSCVSLRSRQSGRIMSVPTTPIGIRTSISRTWRSTLLPTRSHRSEDSAYRGKLSEWCTIHFGSRQDPGTSDCCASNCSHLVLICISCVSKSSKVFRLRCMRAAAVAAFQLSLNLIALICMASNAWSVSTHRHHAAMWLVLPHVQHALVSPLPPFSSLVLTFLPLPFCYGFFSQFCHLGHLGIFFSFQL